MSEDKKKASSKAKSAEEKKKEEVLENIMEELEEEAKEKETAQTPDSQEEKDDAEKEATVEKEENKKEKKNPLQEKIDELNDKVLRQMAEFENFRKRTDKEKSQQFELGQGNVLEKLLPVVDNFERGLAAVPEAEKDGAFADGMNKIYKQLIKQLEDLGVTPIEAVGKEFDPNLHNAVMQVESQEYESGIVAQELQKGYMFHDTVLRHSMVAVAQ
ncbi:MULTISPECIES: nucleotide exchange factor GrpE [unclassified Butyrivibrio]|uniref:nucleotide exchange factor GrpE n=1 Tax=unclassified Butyrivibrio TaxID=2639466 RepID=UPI00040CF6DD|nr:MULTISPECIES: nucleotide exchange factor GrpE [unclassified Butyrivibrio]